MITAVYPDPVARDADEVRGARSACRDGPTRVVAHTRPLRNRPGRRSRDARARGAADQAASSSSCHRSAISSPPTSRCSCSTAAPPTIDDRTLQRGRRIRPRADDGAGPAVRVPHHRRHRAEGAVAGDQRSDDGGARARPDSSPAASRRPAPPARRSDSRPRPATRASSSARRTGRTSSTSRAPRSAPAAPATSRSPGACARCSTT